MEIARTSRSEGPQVQKKLQQGYRKLLTVTRKVVNQAKRFQEEIARGEARERHGSRRSHQRAQTTPRTESLSLSRTGWHATVGGPGGDCRQSDQYRSVPGSREQRIEIEPRAAITKGEREK